MLTWICFSATSLLGWNLIWVLCVGTWFVWCPSNTQSTTTNWWPISTMGCWCNRSPSPKYPSRRCQPSNWTRVDTLLLTCKMPVSLMPIFPFSPDEKNVEKQQIDIYQWRVMCPCVVIKIECFGECWKVFLVGIIRRCIGGKSCWISTAMSTFEVVFD